MPKSECLWLELSRPNSTEKIIVGTIYRHPIQSSLKNFLGSFSDCLNDLSILQKIYYILAILLSTYKSLSTLLQLMILLTLKLYQ